MIAKRADSPYTCRPFRDWLKFKCVRDQELVIGGYTAPKGSRIGFGAVLVGYFDGPDFVGMPARWAPASTRPFSPACTAGDASPREQEHSPFTRGRGVREQDVHWVEPQLVAQVGFTEWTADGQLRHPRFQGLRRDKDPADVMREMP